jgi:hypothetical protein
MNGIPQERRERERTEKGTSTGERKEKKILERERER